MRMIKTTKTNKIKRQGNLIIRLVWDQHMFFSFVYNHWITCDHGKIFILRYISSNDFQKTEEEVGHFKGNSD